MQENNKYQRILDKNITLTEKRISAIMGLRIIKLWKQIRQFLKKNYDFQPELLFYGSKYGWCYRYRRKNKTLCVLYPETKAFTVLVTLGKKEVEHFKQRFSTFNKDTQKLFTNARQYHDGKWIYKRVLNISDVDDVKSLIKIKKEPRNDLVTTK